MHNEYRGGFMECVAVAKLPKLFDKPTDATNAASKAKDKLKRKHPGWSINSGFTYWYGRHIPILYVLIGPDSKQYNIPVGRGNLPVCEVWKAIDKRPTRVAPDGTKSIQVPKQVVRYFGISGEVLFEIETN